MIAMFISISTIMPGTHLPSWKSRIVRMLHAIGSFTDEGFMRRPVPQFVHEAVLTYPTPFNDSPHFELRQEPIG